MIEKNNSHLAGEYFVAAELYRRGFSIGMTIGNAKAIDLFANKDTKTIAIQVKAIKNKKSVGWPLMTDKILDNIIYVFVNLSDYNPPEYYICTSKEVREKIKQYSTRGIVMLTSLKEKKYLDRWDKIRL
jgi:hypothetical protein